MQQEIKGSTRSLYSYGASAHADRDPHAILTTSREQALGILGLTSLLYRRVTGSFTLPMEALDCWVESIGADELGIPEEDENVERVEADRRSREALKNAPEEIRMTKETEFFDFYVSNRERLIAIADEAKALGLGVTQALDRLLNKQAEGKA